MLKPVRELRYNAALQARVHSILRSVRDKELDASAALAELARAEANAPAHNRWLTAVLLGVAASGLAVLLGADSGAVMAAGVATSLGLLARQELGRRHVNMLALPLTAALIGAALGGIAIRFGWTQTPGLVLIVPSLMIIPGPHLINGLLDLIDNYLADEPGSVRAGDRNSRRQCAGDHLGHRADSFRSARCRAESSRPIIST